MAAAVGLVGALTSPLFAANPSSGTVAVPANPGGTASASWTGTIPVAPPNVTGQCSDDTFADAFAVTFTLPSGFYDTRSANFKFSITWTPTNAQADAAYNDEVITVLAPDGTVVARNDGAETTETAVAANLKAGTYKVLACGSINTSDQPYKGSLTVTTTSAASAAKPPRNPNSANDNLLQFTAATVVDPLVFGGEPGLNFDATTDGSRAFVDWPVSSRTNIGVLFRSDDGGLTFRKRYADAGDPSNAGLVCAGRQVPMCTTGGGGDTDVNVNEGNGNVYFASQESLGAQAVASSFDHGVSFDTNHTDPVVSAPCAPVDRQWLASYKGTNDVFLAFHVPVVAECISHSTTGGTTGTWQPPAIGFQNVTQSGALVIDNTGGPHNHTLYVSYIAHVLNGLDDLGTFHVAVSTDDGANWTDHRIPNTASVRSMNKLQIDSAGNLYITWAESNTEHTWLSTSLAADPANAAAPASKWSTPVIVDGDPLTVTIFPDVVAGSPGKIAVSYYGTAADAID
ncbi:MAG: hypothetical protein QOI20_11, partial [Acidimicrobiaceae bacterium]|nr:hypothetical protein [Acidimicrobiaceae bacterium]